MRSIYKYIVFSACLLSLSSCEKEDWLEREAPNVIIDEQVWNDPKMITSLLANYYDRLPTHTSLQGDGPIMPHMMKPLGRGMVTKGIILSPIPLIDGDCGIMV